VTSYLDKLKARLQEKRLDQQLSKPSKAAFEGFEGDDGPIFSEASEVERLCDNAQSAFDERAALSEYDGGLPRSHAELLALTCTVPLAPGETLERREATIIHFAEHLDRLRQPLNRFVRDDDRKDFDL
jgi:hypothetical protein